MIELTPGEAERMLSGLERRRQAAIDDGDLHAVTHLDRRIDALVDAMHEPGDRVTLPASLQDDTSQQPPAETALVHRPTDARLPVVYERHGRDPVTAGLLGILLGGVGAHKFYLGKTGLGVLYLLFFWTLIPSIAGLIEGLLYLREDPEDFGEKHLY